MAQITNFGKAWTLSMAWRLAHPLSNQLYSIDGRIELVSAWIILIRDTYFAAPGGINVDHGTLADIHAQGTGANAVIGLGSHATGAGAWYTGNQCALGVGPTGFPGQITPDNNNESATLNLFSVPRALSFTSQGAGSMPFTIGGIAFCLSNATGSPGVPGTTPGNTEVLAIHEFSSPTSVPVSSSGQILTLSGGNAILSEA